MNLEKVLDAIVGATKSLRQIVEVTTKSSMCLGG